MTDWQLLMTYRNNALKVGTYHVPYVERAPLQTHHLSLVPTQISLSLSCISILPVLLVPSYD
jgi:hypothetical protein